MAKGGERVKEPSALEAKLRLQLRALGLPEPLAEYMAIPGRKFRWDGAWPEKRVLYEVQGGIWHKGGHSTGAGITRDCEKHNLAALHGWRDFLFTAAMVDDLSAARMLETVLEEE